MVYHVQPVDWRDLQNKVKSFFEEMGLEAKTGEVIPLVRGKKEIDVLAQEVDTQPKHKYLVECKNYSNNVSQEKVHAFRTVVTDAGASMGFLISKVGFQKGAFEAAQMTNIRLLNWGQFQDFFEDRWISGVEDKLARLVEPLGEATDHFRGVDDLKPRYGVVYIMSMFRYLYSMKSLKFPMKVEIPKYKPEDQIIYKFESLKDYFEQTKTLIKEGVARLEEIQKPS